MIFITVTEIGATPGILKRELGKMQKKAYTRIGRYWHKQMRPRHFTKAGAKDYAYEPRSGERGSGKSFGRSYTARKLKEHGHTRPLVLTGATELLSRMQDIRATSKGVKVVVHVGNVLRQPKGRAERVRELTMVTPEEQRQLADIYDEEMQLQIEALRAIKKRARYA